MLSPSFYRYNGSFQCRSISFLFQTQLVSLWISEHTIPLPEWISSARAWTIPDDLYLFKFSVTVRTPKLLGSCQQLSCVYFSLLTSLMLRTFNINERSYFSNYSKYCGNMQTNHPSHPSPTNFYTGTLPETHLCLWVTLKYNCSHCLFPAQLFHLSNILFCSWNVHYLHILCCVDNPHSFALDPVSIVILPSSSDLKIFQICQNMVQAVFIHNDLDSLQLQF